MDHKEHDSIAKVVISVLAKHRDLVPEAELRVTVYGDVLLRPGPPLEPTTGLLGELIGRRLVLLEFYFTRPRLMELIGVKAKGALAWAGEIVNKSRLATRENRRIVVIGNGFPRTALRRAWEPHVWRAVRRGLWTVEDNIDAYYVDLLRLPLTQETAWLHVAGDSVWVSDALSLLQAQEDPVTRHMLAQIAKEIPQMQVNEPQPSTGSTRRFLKAWEEVAIRNEGIRIGELKGRSEGIYIGEQKGRNEGRNEGIYIGEQKGRNEGIYIGEQKGRNEALHSMLRLILTQRFGEAAGAVLSQLDSVTDPVQLETLARRSLTIASLDALLVE